MTATLDCRIRSRLSAKRCPETPTLALGQTGLRIAAANLTYDPEAEAATLDVFLAYGFPRPLWRAYRELTWAITLTAEDAATGAAAAVRLKDPYVRYADDQGENFLGLPPDDGDPSPSIESGCERIPLWLEAPVSEHEPSVFLKATFREYVSNTLALNLRDLTVVGA